MASLGKLTIVSNGTAKGTRVFADGFEIYGVSEIELLPINKEGGFIKARLTFENIELDIDAQHVSE